MKLIFSIIAAVLVLVAIQYGVSGSKVKYGTATTAWQTISAPSGTKLYNPNFANDATSGADTLWCAAGSDTVWSTMIPLLKGETVQFNTSSNVIRVKTSAGTIPYRMWGHY